LILSLYVNPKIHPRRASSAHTYRLLVFKDRSASLHAALPPPPGTASFCVAASAAEKRDYEERVTGRQPPSTNFLSQKRQSARKAFALHIVGLRSAEERSRVNTNKLVYSRESAVRRERTARCCSKLFARRFAPHWRTVHGSAATACDELLRTMRAKAQARI
jgi:hypothetical protein